MCFENLRTCHTQCRNSFSDLSAIQFRKMVHKVGIFQGKQVFDIIVLVNHSRIFGFLTLNHCMILQFVIVCISFDSF